MDTMLQRQQAFGYTFEDLRMLMVPMARDGVEAIGSMGTDIPIAVLSNKVEAALRLLQAALRAGDESADRLHPRGDRHLLAVTTIGREGNLLDPKPESCHLIELKTPILSNEELAKLKASPGRVCLRDARHHL
jgi:glutamate synthase (ferredoxin)